MHRCSTRRLARYLVLGCALSLPAALAAQEAVVKTKAGDSFDCTVLSDDGKTISIRTADGEQMTLPYANLDPTTIYRLANGRTAADDGPGQMKVGDAALAADLWANASKHYLLAEKADASLTPKVDAALATTRDDAANATLAQAKFELAHGRPDVAMNHLGTILSKFPHERAAAEASTLFDQLHDQQTAQRQQQVAANQSAALQKELATAEKALTELNAKIKSGLQNSLNQSACISDFQAAIQEAKRGRTYLAGLESKAEKDPALAAAIAALDGELEQGEINGYIQLATAYNQRSSYNDAYATVNTALAIEPDNQELLNLRGQISANNSSSGYGGWGRTERVSPHRR